MHNLWRQRFLSWSLRTHLLLLAFLLTLPSVALMIHSGLEQRKAAYKNGLSEARRLVYKIAFEHYNLTGNTEQLLTVLAQLPEIKKRNAAEVNTILSNIIGVNRQYINIVIADTTGAVWASGLPQAQSQSIKRQYLTTLLSKKKFSSAEPGFDPASRKTIMNLLYPVINTKGAIADVISVNLNFEHLNELLKHSGWAEGSQFTLFGSNGKIISHSPGHYIGDKSSDELFQRMKRGPDEDSFTSWLDGDKHVIAYRKLRLRDEESPYLYILAAIPFQETMQKAWINELHKQSFLSLYLIGAIILSIPLGNYCFVNRIKKLQEASQRLAAGDLEVWAAELVKGGELGELAASFDVMARQLAAREQAICDSREELDDLYNNAPCGYHSLDKDGMLIRMNSTELKRLGYSQDAIVGQINFSEIVAIGDREKFRNSFVLLKERGWIKGLELELLCSNGTTLPVSLDATVLYDTDGQFLLSRSTTYDITERKEAERKLNELNKNLALRVDEEIERRLMHERLLARNARLAAIGEMIGAIAHQWRQPLATLEATIQSITMAWEQRCLDDAFLEKAEADAQIQLNYMSETIEDFRNFFSHEKIVERFDVSEKVHEVVLLMVPQLANSGVQLQIENLTGSGLEIEGYQNEFKQSILNLVSNSLDAIIAKVSAGGVDSSGLIVISLASKGDIVVIEVRDNGCGIPREHAEKVFEPYFTTKSAGKASGIGLYLSRLIIEESIGGRLSFTSGPAGTVFRMEVPRVSSKEGKKNA